MKVRDDAIDYRGKLRNEEKDHVQDKRGDETPCSLPAHNLRKVYYFRYLEVEKLNKLPLSFFLDRISIENIFATHSRIT